jgi:hypothetical protein
VPHDARAQGVVVVMLGVGMHVMVGERMEEFSSLENAVEQGGKTLFGHSVWEKTVLLMVRRARLPAWAGCLYYLPVCLCWLARVGAGQAARTRGRGCILDACWIQQMTLP